MKKISLTVIMLCLALSLPAKDKYRFYPNSTLRPDRTIFLYVPSQKEAKKALKAIPDPVHAKKAETLALKPVGDNGYRGQEEMFDPNGATLYINEWARFDLFFPKENPNGKMIVVCPGGGYNCVCHYIEGLYAADWLTEKGFAVAVVKYRLPKGDSAIPLGDVHNVMRFCRDHQQEWGIDSLGIMGFSAGGHLAASASVLYDDAATRPDFCVLFYPVISSLPPFGHTETTQRLIGDYAALAVSDPERLAREQYKFDLHKHVTADTPPTFIVLTSNDREVNPLNGVAYYQALAASGVPSELHVYHSGIHGFAFDYYKFNPNDWLGEARDDFFVTLSRWLSALK